MNTISWYLLLLHAKVSTVVFKKHVIFHKTVLIHQQLDALPSSELALSPKTQYKIIVVNTNTLMKILNFNWYSDCVVAIGFLMSLNETNELIHIKTLKFLNLPNFICLRSFFKRFKIIVFYPNKSEYFLFSLN